MGNIDKIPATFFQAVASLSHAKAMAFLAGYFDESGTHAGSQIVVVGGLVSLTEQWLEFEKEWTSTLKKHNISVFHRTDLAGKYGEFTGWTQEREIALLVELIEVIARRAPFLIFHAVRTDDFEVVKREFPSVKVSPYQMCCEQTIACMNLIGNIGNVTIGTEPIQVFFEQGRKSNSETIQIYQEAIKYRQALANFSIGLISFGEKKCLPPLQAADFIAYEIYKYRKGQIEEPKKPMWKSLGNLLAKTNSIDTLTPIESIKNWFEIYLQNRQSFK